ncbi:MAG: hypothetical protein KDB07_07090, partial [Planctomycetes bacterium]|nr:hypothetical protein [Planctomycetota bacterium]
LLDRESTWIRKGFVADQEVSHEDLSRVLLRVRRRNPYRKFAIHPAIALTTQLVLALGLVVLLISLNTGLLPPDLVLADIDGTIASPTKNDDGKYVLRVGIPIATPADAQALVSFNGIDDLRLSQSTRLRVAQPMRGIRQVVEIEKGEVWANLRAQDSPMLINFASETLEDVEIEAERAELSVIVDDRAREYLPRKERGDTNAAPENVESVIRLLAGKATLRSSDQSNPITLERGKAYALRGTEVFVLNDPDASVYRTLRLRADQGFKLFWDWSNPEVFPLSIRGAILPVWNIAMQAADEIESRRTKALSRDGEQEIRSARQKVLSYLDASGAPEADLSRLDAISLSSFGETRATLHLPSAEGGNPPLMRVLRPYVEEGMSLAMQRSPNNIEVLRSVLSAQWFDFQRAYNRASSEREHLQSLARESEELEENTDKVHQRLDAHREISELDVDGSVRAAKQEEALALRKQILALEARELDLKDTNEKLNEVLAAIDAQRLKREPLASNLGDAIAARDEASAVLDATRNADEELKLMKEALERAEEDKANAERDASTAKAVFEQAQAALGPAQDESKEAGAELAKAKEALERAEAKAFAALDGYSEVHRSIADKEAEDEALDLVFLIGTDDEKRTALAKRRALREELIGLRIALTERRT